MYFISLFVFAAVVVENITVCKALPHPAGPSPPVGAAWETAVQLKEKLAAFSEFQELYEHADYKTVPLGYMFQYPLDSFHISILRDVMTAFVLSKNWMRKFFMVKYIAYVLSLATPDYKAEFFEQYKNDLQRAIVSREKCELTYDGCASIGQFLGTMPLLNRVNFEALRDKRFTTFAYFRGCQCSHENIETCLTGSCTAPLLQFVALP